VNYKALEATEAVSSIWLWTIWIYCPNVQETYH